MAKPVKILLAEDEPSLAQIVTESLETRNFEVVNCTNGLQALTLYKSEKPSLLVLDVMMPKKDGFTVAKEIRQIDDQIPIIFLTAKSQTKDVVEGFSIGGNDYLKKPFSIEELIVRIDNLLDRKNTQNKQPSIEIGNYTFHLKQQTLQFKEEEPIN